MSRLVKIAVVEAAEVAVAEVAVAESAEIAILEAADAVPEDVATREVILAQDVADVQMIRLHQIEGNDAKLKGFLRKEAAIKPNSRQHTVDRDVLEDRRSFK